jgi:hypothetical protein
MKHSERRILTTHTGSLRVEGIKLREGAALAGKELWG